MNRIFVEDAVDPPNWRGQLLGREHLAKTPHVRQLKGIEDIQQTQVQIVTCIIEKIDLEQQDDSYAYLMTIICATKFNPAADITYREPWTNSKGMKSVGINSKAGGSQLHLRVPMMLTWGVNENEHTPGEKKYDLSLQFPRAGEETDSSRAFLANMEKFEKQLVKDAVSHSQEWWNQKSISEELAADRFHPMLYRSKDKSTGEIIQGKAPSLRVKIDCWDGKFKCEIYDNGGPILTGCRSIHLKIPRLRPVC